MGRGVEEEVNGKVRRKNSLDNILPREEEDYYLDLEKKHFSDQSSGSRFCKGITLRQLLLQNQEKLLSADDDRQKFINLGVDQKALLPDRSYFLLQAPGRSGLLSCKELDPESTIHISKEKAGSLSFLLDNPGVRGEETQWATAVVANYRKDPSRRALITVFPGLPEDPARSSVAQDNPFGLLDGQKIKLRDLQKILARRDLLLQVRE